MTNSELQITVEKLQIWLRKLEESNNITRKHTLLSCDCDDCDLFRRVNAVLNGMYEIQDLIFRSSAVGQR